MITLDHKNKNGFYFGTEIDGKWWKRYRENGFFARGNGHYNIEYHVFCFYKYPAIDPITIPFEKIVDFKIGTWHAGRWSAGMPILKILWEENSLSLSSGFLLSKNKEEVKNIIKIIKGGDR